MKTLAIPAHKQTTDYSCGPASLRMVLGYYGVDVTEREIFRHVRIEPELGTRPGDLRRAALKFGLTGKWSKKATVDDLKRYYAQRVPVVVNWFSQDDGHYSVVVAVSDKRVALLDPEDGKLASFTHDEFMRVWFDFPSPYPRHRYQFRIRWMLPLEKR